MATHRYQVNEVKDDTRYQTVPRPRNDWFLNQTEQVPQYRVTMETELIASCRTLSRKPERKRPHGTPRCKLEENIKKDLKETWRDGVEWINPVPQT